MYKTLGEQTISQDKAKTSYVSFFPEKENQLKMISRYIDTQVDTWIDINRCGRAKLLQSCPTLCNPMNHSLPGSSIHGILQAGILKWIANFLQGIFPTRGSNLCLLCLLHWQVGR